jgi:hypothetical protein
MRSRRRSTALAQVAPRFVEEVGASSRPDRRESARTNEQWASRRRICSGRPTRLARSVTASFAVCTGCRANWYPIGTRHGPRLLSENEETPTFAGASSIGQLEQTSERQSLPRFPRAAAPPMYNLEETASGAGRTAGGGWPTGSRMARWHHEIRRLSPGNTAQPPEPLRERRIASWPLLAARGYSTT